MRLVRWLLASTVLGALGLHGLQRRLGTARLSRGPHRLRIGYEQYDGDYRLEVRLQAPGAVAECIETFALQLSPEPRTERARIFGTLRQHLPAAVVWWWYAVVGALLTGGRRRRVPSGADTGHKRPRPLMGGLEAGFRAPWESPYPPIACYL